MQSNIICAPKIERRRRPILKTRGFENDQYISLDKKSWIVLPVPTLPNQLRSQSQQLVPSNLESDNSARKMVCFGDIQQRFYSQTIGDHPDTSEGPPISLDWNYDVGETIPLEEYESSKGEKKSSSELRLSNLSRRRILVREYGYHLEDIRKAMKQNSRSARQRLHSAKSHKTVMKLENAFKSIGLKTRNMSQPRFPASA